MFADDILNQPMGRNRSILTSGMDIPTQWPVKLYEWNIEIIGREPTEMRNPSATTYAACHSTVSKQHETVGGEVVDLEGFGLDFVFTTITRHYSSFPSMLTSI